MMSSQIRKEVITFFPLLQALAIEKEEDETKEMLNELKSMVESVLKRFEEEVSSNEFKGCIY